MAANHNSGAAGYPRAADIDLTESDATHFRLRNDIHSKEFIICLSCGEKFTCTSKLQLYEHYSEQEHTSCYASCLYCKGKVHQFFRSRRNYTDIYHNCARWRRGEDS